MKLLVINQYFPPDRAATGQLLGQLVEDLSKDFEITVICGSPTYDPEEYDEKRFQNVKILRAPLIKRSRKSLLIRLINFGLYFIYALAHLTRERHNDAVMTWTDPPVVGLLGVLAKKIYKKKFIFVSQDVYPEILKAMKKLDYTWLEWILQNFSKTTLNNADHIIAVGNDMKEVLLQKGAPEGKTKVIYNWQDVTDLKQTEGKIFREMHHIPQDAFLVMHSGNVGFSQDFDSLLKAAEELKNEENIRFAIVGDGSRLFELKTKAAEKKLQNLLFVPYQPGNQLSESLSAADIHYVSLKEELVGLIVPSKIYGIMAVAKPILLNVPQNCDAHTAVQDAECGKISQSQTLVQDIQELAKDQEALKKMGQRGRHWVERHGSRQSSVAAYREVLES